jgi:hypothetical protein
MRVPRPAARTMAEATGAEAGWAEGETVKQHVP